MSDKLNISIDKIKVTNYENNLSQYESAIFFGELEHFEGTIAELKAYAIDKARINNDIERTKIMDVVYYDRFEYTYRSDLTEAKAQYWDAKRDGDDDYYIQPESSTISWILKEVPNE